MPHVAADERYAGLHAVPGGLHAALHVVPRGQCAAQRAVVHAVSYQTLLELVLEPPVLEWLAPERLAVPERQHLTLLALWSAAPTPQLAREE